MKKIQNEKNKVGKLQVLTVEKQTKISNCIL